MIRIFPNRKFSCRPLQIIASVVTLTTLCVACAAYSEAAPVSSSDLTGKWYILEMHPEKGRIETELIINADETFSGTMSINDKQVWNYAGSWTLTDNKITWHYTESSLVLLEEDKAETDEILSVDRESLTYRSGRRGTVSTLERVK